MLSRLQSLRLLYFSKPAADRPLYRVLHQREVRKIVELGVGDGQRALRMIDLAKQKTPESEIHYVGMDPFEARPAAGRGQLTLKEAHQRLRNTGVRVQLVPGNPPESLIRLANSLGKIDLLIVPADLDSAAMARAWFFVPRVLHPRTLVFVEQPHGSGSRLTILPRSEIDRLAAAGFRRRAA